MTKNTIEQFRQYQPDPYQRIELLFDYDCGATAMYMGLVRLGVTDWDRIGLMHALDTTSDGTSWSRMVRFAQRLPDRIHTNFFEQSTWDELMHHVHHKDVVIIGWMSDFLLPPAYYLTPDRHPFDPHFSPVQDITGTDIWLADPSDARLKRYEQQYFYKNLWRDGETIRAFLTMSRR